MEERLYLKSLCSALFRNIGGNSVAHNPDWKRDIEASLTLNVPSLSNPPSCVSGMADFQDQDHGEGNNHSPASRNMCEIRSLMNSKGLFLRH